MFALTMLHYGKITGVIFKRCMLIGNPNLLLKSPMQSWVLKPQLEIGISSCGVLKRKIVIQIANLGVS